MDRNEFLRNANARELEMYAAMLKADAERRRARWHVASIVLALIVFTLLLTLGGCATVYPNRGTATAEAAWQTLAAVDTMQTVTIARSPKCLYEANGMAADIYGSEHPSESRVLATNAALATLHFYVGGWIDRHVEDDGSWGWKVLKYSFYGVSFAYSGQAVVHNARMGIEPMSHYARGC
jgi:hypothetical protein